MLSVGIFSLTLSPLFLGGCQMGKKASLKTDEDKAFYSMGVMFGSRLKELALSDNEIDLLVQGLRDSAAGKKPEVDPSQFQIKMQELFRTRMTKIAEENKKKGADFLDNFVKKEGATKTASGLAYKILQEGTANPPKAQDTVEVHYHGTLIDGTVFDSSKERGKTVSFPLDRVIKGWTEGLQLLKPGGKIKLVIPPELGYGEHGAPPKIPGGATLVFEVELFKVSPTEAPAIPTPVVKSGSAKKGKKK